MIKDIKIRQYKDSDKSAVKALHKFALESTNAYATSGKWDTDLDDIANIYLEFLVVFKNEELIAMGALKKINNETVELKRMRVHPKFQGQGIGQRLLEILEQKSKKHGFKKIILDTTIKQIAAQKMYEKNGYKEIRRETKGWPMKMIFYEKTLP